jgi:putative DNA primase/helicase
MIIEGIECRVGGDALSNVEHQVLKFRQMVWQKKKFDPGSSYTHDALVTESLDHVFDPVRDYLDGLVWDGVPRIDRWLVDYCRAADAPLVRAFARKVLLAAVRRVRQPGCKFDFILVLEGPQGIGKSSLLRILAGDENFSDNEILRIGWFEQERGDQSQALRE